VGGVRRGEIWWIDFGETQSSAPGFRRPVLIIQADYINQSRIQTVIVASLTTNLERVGLPGCIYLEKQVTGLSKDSIVNLTQFQTVDKDQLIDRRGMVPSVELFNIDLELRRVLGLGNSMNA
jgi:mRNA interferase MazF